MGRWCRSFDQYDLVLFCYECGGAPLRQLLAEAKPADGQKLRLAIVTGAEGGFAAEEAEMAAKAGAKTVGLGPRILRCETAPLAVLSAVMTLTGESGVISNKRLLHRILCNSLLLFCVILRFVKAFFRHFPLHPGGHRCPAEPVLT